MHQFQQFGETGQGEDLRKKGGEFYTPRAVVRMMVSLAEPTEGMRVYDPCSGSGGMLILAKEYLEEHGKDSRNLRLYGQESNGGVWAISKMNMLLHGIPDADLPNSDTLAGAQGMRRLTPSMLLRRSSTKVASYHSTPREGGGEQVGVAHSTTQSGLRESTYGREKLRELATRRNAQHFANRGNEILSTELTS